MSGRCSDNIGTLDVLKQAFWQDFGLGRSLRAKVIRTASLEIEVGTKVPNVLRETEDADSGGGGPNEPLKLVIRRVLSARYCRFLTSFSEIRRENKEWLVHVKIRLLSLAIEGGLVQVVLVVKVVRDGLRATSLLCS